MTALLCASIFQVALLATVAEEPASPSPAATATAPVGVETYDDAHREAEKTGKPIVVMVGTDWCAPCQMMKKTILPRVREHGLFRKVAFAVVNPDRDGELVQKLTGGGPIPQLVMFRRTDKGWMRKKLVGGQSVETVEEFIKDGLAADEADKISTDGKGDSSAPNRVRPPRTSRTRPGRRGKESGGRPCRERSFSLGLAPHATTQQSYDALFCLGRYTGSQHVGCSRVAALRQVASCLRLSGYMLHGQNGAVRGERRVEREYPARIFHHGGADIPVCQENFDLTGRQKCLPHRLSSSLVFQLSTLHLVHTITDLLAQFQTGKASRGAKVAATASSRYRSG